MKSCRDYKYISLTITDVSNLPARVSTVLDDHSQQASPASIEDLTPHQLQAAGAIFRWCIWCFNISSRSPAAGWDQKKIMSSCGLLVAAAEKLWNLIVFDVSTMKIKSWKIIYYGARGGPRMLFLFKFSRCKVRRCSRMSVRILQVDVRI